MGATTLFYIHKTRIFHNLMLYLTSATNHEECDESCTRNTMSLIEYWGRQMVRFGCKNGSLCYTKERKEMYGK